MRSPVTAEIRVSWVRLEKYEKRGSSICGFRMVLARDFEALFWEIVKDLQSHIFQCLEVLWKQSTGYTESVLVERLRMEAEGTAEFLWDRNNSKNFVIWIRGISGVLRIEISIEESIYFLKVKLWKGLEERNILRGEDRIRGPFKDWKIYCGKKVLLQGRTCIVNERPMILSVAYGEGTSQADRSAHLSDVQETSSWRFSYDNEVPILENPEHLALIWRKIREKGCDLPSLGDMRERDAYVWMAVANAKQLRGELEAVRVTGQQREVEIEGLQGKLSAAETEKVAVQNDLNSMKEKHRREIEGRDAATPKECNLARRSLAREYDAVLAVVKDKLQKKKKEMAADIRLQKVRTRIEALTEYSKVGFELEEELERLRGQDISLNVDYGLASVSDPSLSRLKLPEVSGDSVDQD
ncbi:hypothetical protein F2Q69_00053018 [Brassica cretica]|uniref:Uncharacterized protein n=1 Tax=Brassica cretica TaxID=69181 RepID=A0A8S9MSN0_BRACR|nr:hypothetical protein F2Q69_00053018 [Brassica cretica]